IHREGHGVARTGGARTIQRPVPAARLAHQPAAVLGRADPDHPLPDLWTGRRARRPTPVLLPDDADFQLGGESPLARHPTWKHVTCPSCLGQAVRDTDTMDTFVDSSW